jgi:hypothetical protein
MPYAFDVLAAEGDLRTLPLVIRKVVSKHLDRAYGAGRCNHWIEIENPAHPYSRERT